MYLAGYKPYDTSLLWDFRKPDRDMPNQSLRQYIIDLEEQCRRANALVDVVFRCSPTCICQKCKALAAYLGESNDD